MLNLNKRVYDSIISHAERGMPYEVCGYLAERDGRVVQHYELSNTDEAADHFSMDPAEQFAVLKEARQKGVKLTAVYHSHPETPARPSAEDIKLAYDPTISYVIISMAEDNAVVKSFRIKQGEVIVEPIKIY